MAAYTVDILAITFFILEWSVYAYTLERTSYGQDSLSARMHAYREKWIRRVLERDARMVDVQIMISLQNAPRSLPPPPCSQSAARWRCCGRPMMRWSS